MALAVAAWQRSLDRERERLRELAQPATRRPYSWEVTAAKTAHRRVQVGVGGGQCRWCEAPIIGKRGKYIGQPDPSRSWCRDDEGRSECLRQFNLHSRAEFQFNWLVGEHGEKCAGCGADKPPREREWYGFTETVTDLAVDHVEPLWLVVLTVPVEDRRPYFGPANLQLLCTPCHNRKSKREAALRALMKRQLCLAL